MPCDVDELMSSAGCFACQPPELNMAMQTELLCRILANTTSGTPPGGSNQQVQFNNAGAFGGDATFLFDSATKLVTVQDLTISAMTAGSVLFAGTGGRVTQDNVEFFFDDATNIFSVGSRVNGLSGFEGFTKIYGNAYSAGGGALLVGVVGESNPIGAQGLAIGGYFQALYNSVGDTATSILGVLGKAQLSAGTATSVWGIDIEGTISGGTATSVRGMRIQANMTGGATTDIFGIHTLLTISGGTATNSYGAWIETGAAGTVTNRFGLHVQLGHAAGVGVVINGLTAATGDLQRWNINAVTRAKLTPTAFSLSSTMTGGITQFLTSDETTNVEKLEMLWSSSVATFGTRTVGTATTRPLHLFSQTANAGADYAKIIIKRNSFPFIKMGFYTSATNETIGTTTATGNLIQVGDGTNTATSGTIAILAVTPTYNQASGAAANTDLLINRTQTAVGSGNQNFLDMQVAGTSRARISTTGQILSSTMTGGLAVFNTSDETTNTEKFEALWSANVMLLRSVAAGSGTVRVLSLVSGASIQIRPTGSTSGVHEFLSTGHTTSTAGNIWFRIASGTTTASSGTSIGMQFTSTYNQSSTAAGTDLLINRTETAIGSGTHRLIDAQVGGASKFSVDRAGGVRIGGANAANQISVVDRGTSTQNPASLAASTFATLTFTITGSLTTDQVLIQLPDSWATTNMIGWKAWIQPAGTANVQYYNPNAVGSIDLASADLRYTLLRE